MGHRSILASPLGAAVLLSAMGCGPAVRLENPASWPALWQGRQFYNTPNAFVYATSDSAADEKRG